jgi:large subunit ribosomal protein L24
MKKKFSKKWKESKQPRKQRKYLANAPLHIKRKFLSVNLSRDLREKHQQRNIVLIRGDVVKIMRGKFKKKQGKIREIKTKLQKIYIENIQTKKTDGSKVNVPLKASNLQIIQLNLEDKKRKLKKKIEIKPEKKNKNKSEKKKKEINSKTKVEVKK